MIKITDNKTLSENIDKFLLSLSIKYFKEKEEGDFYFQIDSDNIFVFSIDIRKDLSEFFLKQNNFIIINNNEDYHERVFKTVKQIIEGEYRIIKKKYMHKTIESKIIFEDNFIIILLSSFLLKRLVKIFSKNFTVETIKGVRIK